MNAIRKIVMGLVVFCAAAVCSAADYYIATPENGGDDGNAGTSGAPFATIAKGIAEAKAAGGGTVRVGEGTYEENSLVLDAAITVVSEDEDRSKVTVHNANWAKQTFVISAAGAAIRHLTIQGPYTSKGGNQNSNKLVGGCLKMTADGEVADCEIFYGVSGTSSGGASDTSGKGGNIWMNAGRVVRCHIHHGFGGHGGYNQANNLYAIGASVIENCLITNGSDPTTGKRSPVTLGGTAKMVNCTVAKNSKGIYCESANVMVVNTAVFGNGGTKATEWLNTNGNCFRNCAFANAIDALPNQFCVKMAEADFADYANGDYRPTADGALVDAGRNGLYSANGATSATDLAGNPRHFRILDIGAYEAQPATLAVEVGCSVNNVTAGTPVALTALALSAKGEIAWEWKVNGGEFAAGAATYALDTPADGVYTVVAKATAGGETAEATIAVRVIAADAPVAEAWVDITGDDITGAGLSASPFATIAHAKDFLAAHPSEGVRTIHVLPGIYDESGLVLDGAYVVRGEGMTRDGVVVEASLKGRAFTLSAAGATLANLTVSGGKSSLGGNVSMVAGTLVTNCVVTGGQSVYASSKDYGGNIYMTGGTVSGCEVKDGTCTGANNYSVGPGIYAAGGLIENCYVHGNYGRTNGNKIGAVDLRGAAYCVNCTVVDNYDTHPTTIRVSQVHVGNTSARVVNCVLFKAVDKAGVVVDGDNGGCYYGCAASATIANGKDCLVIDQSAFRGALGGDYRLIATSPLLDHGDANASVKYSTYAKSAVDFDGNTRVSPSEGTIDIGCYEFDLSSPAVGGVAGKYAVAVGAESVGFTADAVGIGGAPVLFKWDFDDGEGSVKTTGSKTYDYAFVNPGLHTVSVSMSVDGGSTWSDPFVLAERVVAHPAVMFVDPTKSTTPAFPYATRETAAWTVKDALNCLTNNFSSGAQVSTVSAEIRLLDGDLAEIGIKLNAAVTITSDSQDAARASVVGNSSGRSFYLDHDAARVSFLTVKNGCSNANGYQGGNIYVNRGLVEDCIVKDGGGATPNGNGGNVFLVGGRVRRCVISGGKCTYSGSGLGGNVYVNGAGIIENCLISGGMGASNNYKGQVYLNHASARLVNCTVVKGVCSGTGLPGVYVNNAGVKVVNCAIFDNGGTVAKEWGNANAGSFVNCAFGEGLAPAGTACIDTVTEPAFRNYSNGDYHPAAGSALLGAGSTWEEYLDYGATSRTDLEGKSRKTGPKLDLGCYAANGAGLRLFIR